MSYNLKILTYPITLCRQSNNVNEINCFGVFPRNFSKVCDTYYERSNLTANMFKLLIAVLFFEEMYRNLGNRGYAASQTCRISRYTVLQSLGMTAFKKFFHCFSFITRTNIWSSIPLLKLRDTCTHNYVPKTKYHCNFEIWLIS